MPSGIGSARHGSLPEKPAAEFFVADRPWLARRGPAERRCGGAILPLWMAKDAGFYEREGLDVEQIWIQGNPATAALIAGEIDALYCIPHNTISAIAGGAELLFVASIYNRMQYRIVAGAGIDKMEQLRGKIVGVARLQDVAHFYLRLALKRFGMSDRDVQMAAVGGQSDRVLALKN